MQNTDLFVTESLAAMEIDPAYHPLLSSTHIYDHLSPIEGPETLLENIRLLGDLLNQSEKATELREHIEERLDIIVHKLKFIPHEHRPTVLFSDDLYLENFPESRYISHLIHLAGGVDYKLLNKEDTERLPDIIILANDSPLSEQLGQLPNTLSRPHWSQTPAVRNNGVYLVHNPAYLRNPGIRIAEDTEILAEIINPKYFIYGRDEDVWLNFQMG